MDVSSEKTNPSSLPFRSKKNLRSNSKSLLEDPQSLSSKTPEKAAAVPNRIRNRKVALSIKEVRRAAESVRGSDHHQQPIRSARRQIDSWQNKSPSVRSKASLDKSRVLPQKFEILSKFFESLDSAMRLLRCKGVSSNFSNVCPKIEVLTDRRFSFGHLAELKFILPEVIELKEVRIFDERTSCFKPDLHISFNFGVLDNQDDLDTGNQYMKLRQLFKARLLEFVNSHPEIDDVPKALLPKPFNCPSQGLFSESISSSPLNTSIEQPATSSTKVTEEIPFNLHSEESQGFRTIKSMVPMTVTRPSKQKEFLGTSLRFSKKFVKRELENADQSSYVETNINTELCNAASSSQLSSPVKLQFQNCLENYASPIRSSSLPQPTTPSNKAGGVTMTKEDVVTAKTNDINSTPAKLASTPARLMASTPAMPPPKRSSMSPDDDDSSCSTNKLVRRQPRSRSLVFDTPTKEDKNEDELDGISASFDNDILGVLSPSLLKSIREKERKAKEEQSPAISQAKRRKKMIANLPQLFNAILFLFHKRAVVTKEELIYKIIVGNSDIVDKREVEEQLTLLLELVPEWISEKLASSGDVLIRIEKLSSAEMVRSRLEEAK